MAFTYGLTESGFNLPDLASLTEETKTTFKSVFGENFNTGSNSIADKLISILNERELQIYQLMAAVYAAQTQNGAEGIYLDDLLAKRGVYRLGKTRSTGPVVMTIDSSVPYNMIYSADTYDIDSGNYQLSGDVQVAGNIVAHKLTGRTMPTGTYRFSIQNTNDQTVKNLTLNLAANTGAPLAQFFNQIRSFIVDNTTPANQDRIFIDSVEGVMYIGYDTSKTLVGLVSKVDFRTSPLVGDKTILMDVRSVEAGAISRAAHSIRNISPSPSGFLAIDNLVAFTDGSDVESDNEYRLRAATAVNASGKATRPAILSALLNKVEGIEKVKIFNNNTGTENALGIPPYRFMVVCFGGSTEQISQVLYDTIALSNNTYGTSFHDVDTADGQTERIWHSKATIRPMAARIKYAGRALSTAEETSILSGITQMVNGLSIAGTIYNVQLVGIVMGVSTPGRFTQIVVELKDKDAPDTAYTTQDITAEATEVFNLDADDVTFNQIV